MSLPSHRPTCARPSFGWLPKALLAAALAFSSAGASALNRSAGRVSFQKDIQPIFATRCYGCHGPDKQENGFRLDNKKDAFWGGKVSRHDIVPGNSAASDLVRRITSHDPDERMPHKRDPLSPRQIALIKTWIDQGADWPRTKHWSYVPPVKAPLPKVSNPSWVRDPIDDFVMAGLDQAHLKPSPEADKATLIRRVSLDLIGLPPTLGQVNAFLNDNSPNAYEKVVDRLLSSPHFGERWARFWLDLARYADTHGFEKDPRRSIWPYRDWVINAFNKDMPFDQFTIKQIAGDMLPHATLADRVASGFNRNTMLNTEGGVDPVEARFRVLIDRVDTTATVWLGSTLGCAQCHSHKFDPFTQKEYYQFYAFFNSQKEPTIQVPSARQKQRQRQLDTQINQLQTVLDTQTPALDQAQAKWERQMAAKLAGWHVLDPSGFVSSGGASLKKLPDHSILTGGKNPKNDAYIVTLHLAKSEPITALRLEVLPDKSLPHKSLGRQPNGSFVLNRFVAKIAPEGFPEYAQSVPFKTAVADYTQKGHNATNLIDGQPGPGWAVDAGNDKMRVARSVYFYPARSIAPAKASVLTILLENRSKWPQANLGRFKLFASTASHPEPMPALPDKIQALLKIPSRKRGEKQKTELAAYYRSIDPSFRPQREKMAKLKKEREALEKAIPTTLALQQMAKPRQTYLHVRGSFAARGQKVYPGVPAALLARGEPRPTNRLQMAKWLVSTNNPLTARVIVNQFWAQIFGQGIVRTVEDFGTQGDPPTHPKLLDWLAVEFMKSHWDMKHVLRLVVDSATYRQSSRITPELRARDPENRLLARGPRFRVDAETIRDIALRASGLLCEKIGGPSVFPPQPAGVWSMIYNSDRWITSKGGDKYRRGLYTFIRRTAPYPSFVVFDATSREITCPRRSRTTTPLQALTTLNDPAYVEMAQALARRIMRYPDPAPKRRIEYAFRLCLTRFPHPKETERLFELYQKEFAKFQANTPAAKKMATSFLGPVKGHLEIHQLAAWTVVANVLLNLDETITKG